MCTMSRAGSTIHRVNYVPFCAPGYYNPATAAAEYYQVYAQQAAAAQQQAGLGQQQMSSYGTGYNQRAAFNTAESAYTNRHSSSGGGYGYDSYGDGGQSASAAATAAG